MAERKVCLVTGGASGIGEACARAFVARGDIALIGDIQDAKASALAKELGPMALALHLDVREEKDFENACRIAQERYGRLDVLVNNAAIVGTLGPIASIPVEEWDYSQNVILRSVFLGMKHAARAMTPRQAGNIVNIASAAGMVSGYSPHIYAPASRTTAGRRAWRRFARCTSTSRPSRAWASRRKSRTPCAGSRARTRATSTATRSSSTAACSPAGRGASSRRS